MRVFGARAFGARLIGARVVGVRGGFMENRTRAFAGRGLPSRLLPPKFFRMNPRKALPATQLIQNPENTLLSLNTNPERLKLFKEHQKGETLLRVPSAARAAYRLLLRFPPSPFGSYRLLFPSSFFNGFRSIVGKGTIPYLAVQTRNSQVPKSASCEWGLFYGRR